MKPLILVCVLFLLVGCGEKFTCPNQPLLPVFIGYTDSEVDSIVLKRFALGSNFSQLIDSFLYTPRNTSFSRRADSVYVHIYGDNKRIDDEVEYQLINFFDGKTVSISEALFEKREGRGSSLFGWGGNVCTSPVISYKRNGITVAGAKSETEFLYIRK